jgi:hypothetical protein
MLVFFRVLFNTVQHWSIMLFSAMTVNRFLQLSFCDYSTVNILHNTGSHSD